MISKGPLIAGVLTLSLEEFKKHILFANKTTHSLHIDVIDGEFCNGKTLPINEWPTINTDYSEAHLMVKKPLDYFEQLAKKKITRAIVHIESDFDLVELQKRAKELDILLGFAVNPDTDLDRLRAVTGVCNYVQVMGVHPGLSNQEMIAQTPLAISYLKKTPSRRLIISVDGGVSTENALLLKQAGATYLVTTHALFKGSDWPKNYQDLLASLEGEL